MSPDFLKSDPGSKTSTTLLERLGRLPTDQAAWKEFVDRYGPKICQWCRHWHLQEAEVQEVTQEVLLKLAVKMRTFRYDTSRSFRGWLKTLTRHAWSDLRENRQRLLPAVCHAPEELETIAAREDLVQRLEEEFDRELLETAMARVQVRVQVHTWDAFRLTALEGLSGADAAARLDLPVASVFVAKYRVQQMLREEVARLEGNSGEQPEELS
ncbi:MAG: RNA polymerase sigma factor [Planctomycetes bacterium]|nr:RNA polymerase sigma factor [Planctomycetota bacterium]